ncbi:DUF4405 domain-containing protein [Raoultibacter phocaeensis]|uniref:DUF4405 domain-containing protein n=1 Tax=Raoultibacter phocaeensis TaxID=2479841 RepID=UPI00111B10E9|nr:DUF4405 domain-containing protein [Raoultibacter phocaeensis]
MDRKRFVVDAIALAVYLVVANPALTGIAVHEWLGLAVFVVFLAHAVQHAGWIADTVSTAVKSPAPARIANLALDALILVAFMVVTVSGLLVSGAVLPALGLYADGYYFWDPLHSIAAKALLALLLVHVVVHWKWLCNFAKQKKGGPGEGPRCDPGRARVRPKR